MGVPLRPVVFCLSLQWVIRLFIDHNDTIISPSTDLRHNLSFELEEAQIRLEKMRELSYK